MAGHGDDTPYGFRIPSSWPRWKKKCEATRRSAGTPCQKWATRGMPTCRIHGSGGDRNAKLGLIRYLAWIICGAPQDIPVFYAQYASMAVILQQLFNNGKGTPEQRLRAGLWMMEIGELEPSNAGRRPLQRMITDDVTE